MKKEERIKILEMLKEGIINVDDAEKLLNAVDKDELVISKNKAFKMLKIEIDSDDGDEVKIQIPIEFAKLLKGNNFNFDLGDHDIDIDALIEMVNAGAFGELVNINSGGDKVVIKVE